MACCCLTDGSVLVSDAGNNRVMRVKPPPGPLPVPTPEVGGACAGEVFFGQTLHREKEDNFKFGEGIMSVSNPSGMAALPDGTFLVADKRANCVIHVDPKNGMRNGSLQGMIVAGGRGQGPDLCQLSNPHGIAFTIVKG
jgi:hypothetical protein